MEDKTHKVGYLNGERVYVHSHYQHDIKIFKHKDAVKILNRIFKQAEEFPENVSEDMFSLLYSLEVQLSMPAKSINGWRKDVSFDDPEKITKIRTPRLHIKTHNQQTKSKFIVHKGGLYKPPAKKTIHNLLSEEFGTFRKRKP